jgi:maltooligosyltrehalose trehalohydrolase
VIPQLDRLVDLGIDAIEVMPIAAFDGAYGWGYDGVAVYAVHEPYGGPDGFKRLVDAAHARGLGVILDVVYNHFGPTGSVLEQFGPYTTDRHQTPWGDAVNLDGPDCAPVRQFFIDNACQWFVEHHVDGLRLDAVHALVDESERHFLDELSETVDALASRLRRPAWLVAEYPHTEAQAVCAREAGGHGLDAEWRDEVHHAVHAWLTGERAGYYADFGRVADVADALVGPAEPLPRSRFVVCAQNHDQVGNRARGERLCHLVDTGLAKAAAAIVLCSPFVPMLFMGEEWAASTPFPYFAGPRNDDLDESVRKGRAEEFSSFGWDPDSIPDPIAESTFRSAVLRWKEVGEGTHAEMLAWYRDVIALRRRRPELCDPRPQSTAVDEHDHETSIVVWRGDTAIAVNTGAESMHIALEGMDASCRLLLASDDDVRLTEAGVHLPSHSVAIVGRS